MDLKVIDVIADAGHADTVRGIVDQFELLDVWASPPDERGRCYTRILVQPDKRQQVMDALQSTLGDSDQNRIMIYTPEVVWPVPRESEDKEKPRSTGTTREELYNEIERGARLNGTYLFLVFLSTIVAAIGLIEDNVAVVIGAMVIAPLLGPNLALALGSALGDRELTWRALKTGISGVFLAFSVSVLIGMFWNGPLYSQELMTRTSLGLDSLALALASGLAAALSLTTGLSSVLVGVMVAVALLPPTSTAGIMLGHGEYSLAVGAGMLLLANVVCVNLAAKLIFLYKGVRPRTWLEKQKARQSFVLYLMIWVISLLILVAIIYARS